MTIFNLFFVNLVFFFWIFRSVNSTLIFLNLFIFYFVVLHLDRKMAIFIRFLIKTWRACSFSKTDIQKYCPQKATFLLDKKNAKPLLMHMREWSFFTRLVLHRLHVFFCQKLNADSVNHLINLIPRVFGIYIR